MSISKAIKEFAFDQGFCAAGITTTDPFPVFTKVMEDSKSNYDFIAQWPTDLAASGNPRNRMPEGRSIISLSFDYMRSSFPQKLLKHVARAYQARCYCAPPERLNGGRIKILHDYIASLGCKIHIGDPLILPDRWVAARAGIATFGRNNFAYTTGVGSFVIYTSIMVDKELEYDTPTLELGCPPDCRICMDACPTGAIYAPNRLNPKRCIAYNQWWKNSANDPATPEINGYIDHDIREAMGESVHGCDTCQEACPRNGKQLKRAVPADPFLELISEEFTLDKMLAQDDDFYKYRIKPIMYNYIRNNVYHRRNAAIAIGNSRDPKYISSLEKALRTDVSPIVRGHAAWAVGKINDSRSRPILESALLSEDDSTVLSEIKTALAIN